MLSLVTVTVSVLPDAETVKVTTARYVPGITLAYCTLRSIVVELEYITAVAPLIVVLFHVPLTSRSRTVVDLIPSVPLFPTQVRSIAIFPAEEFFIDTTVLLISSYLIINSSPAGESSWAQTDWLRHKIIVNTRNRTIVLFKHFILLPLSRRLISASIM